MGKLITFAVPCYNSSAYMRKCIDSLLVVGKEAEILIIDDGSSDDTYKIAEYYEKKYPSIVKAIHKENGGHGSGVNLGLLKASGVYYKVVDSDDWLDKESLPLVIKKLKTFKKPIDMMICNYVYEYTKDGTKKEISYKKKLPEKKIFSWEEVKNFKVYEYLLMHSVIYNRNLLLNMNLELPHHMSYVDNLFVFEPLIHVKRMYYFNVPLYRYFIGREDQTVNETVMIKKIDQQLFVTNRMRDYYVAHEKEILNQNLKQYMLRYLAMMYVVSCSLLCVGKEKSLQEKRKKLWSDLKETDKALYHTLKYHSIGFFMFLPRNVIVIGYKIAHKIFKFN